MNSQSDFECFVSKAEIGYIENTVDTDSRSGAERAKEDEHKDNVFAKTRCVFGVSARNQDVKNTGTGCFTGDEKNYSKVRSSRS